MPSPTGEERPDVPVMCCGAFQASETHFAWNAVAGAWGCALKGSTVISEPPEAPRPPAPAPKPTPKPRTTRKKP